MKTIQWIKVKFRKLRIRDNKVDDLEHRRFHQVTEERDSLKDQLSEANRKIAELENMARAFQAQESLNHQVSHAKKEEDGGIKNSLTDQQSVGEKVIKRFEHRIEAKDEKIRLLKYEVAMKDEEIRSLKSERDRREEEYTKLRNNIQSAYTDMENAVAILGSAFMFTGENPPEKDNYYSYDLIGAKSSAGDQTANEINRVLRIINGKK
ncbi:hypothetical protein OIU79_029293 [Salix purpurea]|uniref:Uncharacterized protein n=1 Tax=Salix purpurea TaxID=77065 RepID=A0A9Q0ZVE6_SALPP|nr:hypothetical protein OIU79_029293 [Salix purpurea]